MAVEFRRGCCRSWADPDWSKVMSARLGEKLWNRCRGEEGVLITLTYDRKEYASARDLWFKQQARQDVPLFLRRLGRALDRDLRGKWFAKVEFQEAEWVHFHLILLGVGFIDHKLLKQAWGMGHVWINGLTEKRVKYACKYVVKGGAIPPWLLGEASLRIIRVSNGFWDRDGGAGASIPDAAPDDGLGDGDEDGPCRMGDSVRPAPGSVAAPGRGAGRGRDEDRGCYRVIGAYVPLGERLRRSRMFTEVRDGDKRFFARVPVDFKEFYSFASRAMRMELSSVTGGGSPGWLSMDIDWATFKRWEEVLFWDRRAVDGGCPAANAAGLHLTDCHEDDVEAWEVEWESAESWSWQGELVRESARRWEGDRDVLAWPVLGPVDTVLVSLGGGR